MAITRVSQSTLREGLEKSNSVAAGITQIGRFDSIATINATGSDGGGGHRFANIPQRYRHLQLRALVRGIRTTAATDFLFLRLNTDPGGSSYAWHSLQSDGTTVTPTAIAAGTTTYMAFAASNNVPAASNTANVFAAFIIDILDYSNTSKNKVVTCYGGYDNNSSGLISFGSGLWLNTAAVTDISLGPAVDIAAFRSTYALYGIGD